VRFWDSSALVPLVVDEETTDAVNALAATDSTIVVSFVTPIEVESAIWRRTRGTLDAAARQRSHQRLAALHNEWIVVDGYASVLAEAQRMVGRHGLRGADAIQLAAAIIVRGSGTLPFVTFDDELITAARAEGFPVLP